MPAIPRTTALAILLLAAFASAAVFLAGVASLHSACRKNELDMGARIAIMTAAGIPGHESCAWTQGWQWLVVFGELVWLALAGSALLCCSRLALPALALLTVWTSFVMPLCNSYLALHYRFDEFGISAGWLTARAASCGVAGTLLTSVFNLILLVALACCATGPGTGTCCDRKPSSAAPSPVPQPVAVQADTRANPATTAAFIAKTEAAAAAGMV